MLNNEKVDKPGEKLVVKSEDEINNDQVVRARNSA